MTHEPPRRTARLSVGRSELHEGDEVVHIFGMPSRIDSSRWGPRTRALWERTVSTARGSGSTALDLDAWEAAVRDDSQSARESEPDGSLADAGSMIKEIVPPDTHSAFAAMQELRPHWSDPEAFCTQVDTLQRPAGYRLAGCFDSDNAAADAVIGFRLMDTLAWGRIIYVDDLSTRSIARRRGFGRQLLDWVHAEAATLGCGAVHLDSGVGPTRSDAHRLYLNAGYSINSHHFAKTL